LGGPPPIKMSPKGKGGFHSNKLPRKREGTPKRFSACHRSNTLSEKRKKVTRFALFVHGRAFHMQDVSPPNSSFSLISHSDASQFSWMGGQVLFLMPQVTQDGAIVEMRRARGVRHSHSPCGGRFQREVQTRKPKKEKVWMP
jgi:hypothetical protein